jgi:DNA-binding CsgD family transcriptional regulator
MLFLLFAGHSNDILAMNWWYCAFLACAFVLVLFCIVLRTKFLLWMEDKTILLLAIFISKTIVKIAVFIPALNSTIGLFLLVADVVLSAGIYVLLGFMWTARLSALTNREGTLLASSSFLVSFLLQLGIAQTPLLSNAFSIIIPLASALCWFFVREKIALTCSEGPGLEKKRYRASAFILLMVAFLFAGSILRGAFIGQPEIAFTSGALLLEGSSIAFSLLVFVLCFFLPPKPKLFNILWIVLTTVFSAGLFLMVILSPDNFLAARQFVVMGRTCLFLLLLMMLTTWVRTKSLSPVVIFGLYFLVVDLLSSFVGYIVTPALISLSGVSLENWSVYLSLGIAFLLVIASFIFFPHSLAPNDNQAPVPPSGVAVNIPTDRTQFLEICKEKGLTGKESEVAVLLAQGYSQRKISQMNYVAIGTTQTHIKSIYRKFGIHSKQDLIALANQTIEQHPED